ncbi:MAG: tyrosine-type recombinase/integrase [Patescibacteria group bacterium]|nr:tyrosine-type recombinase/integrase [Patescibacteria group bacterium]
MHELQSGSSRIVTLRQVWDDYQRSRKLKATTAENYRQRLYVHLKDWLDLPVTSITKDMVEERHRSIKGEAIANSTMRTLRAMLHYAAVKYEDGPGNPIIKINPVARLTEVRAWHKDRRRTTVIRPQQLRAWFRGVYSINNSSFRDLLLFLLFSGLRKSEAINLRWEDVDLQSGIATIRNTKNGDDFELPMNEFNWRLLEARSLGSNGEGYVFPGKYPNRPISAGTKSFVKACKQAGMPFSLHDLRRTFVTIGDELDIKTEAIKALVNHRIDDVTEGYIIRSPERLRRVSQKICDAILTHAGFARTGQSLTNRSPL